MPVTSLPPVQETELALSVERAYREALVTDRLGAIWSLILAKCFLAQCRAISKHFGLDADVVARVGLDN